MSPNVAVTVSSSPHIPGGEVDCGPIKLEREEQRLLEHVCAAYSDEICNDMLNTDRGPEEFSRKYLPELWDLLTRNQTAPGEFLGAVMAWEAEQPRGEPANEMARLFHIMVLFVLAGATTAIMPPASAAAILASNPGYRRKLKLMVAMAGMHKVAMVQFIKDNPGCTR